MPPEDGKVTQEAAETTGDEPATVTACTAVHGHQRIFHELMGVTKFNSIMFCDGISEERR